MAFLDELCSTRKPLPGSNELGLSLGYDRLRSCLLGFPLGHLAFRGVDTDHRLLEHCLGLTELRLEHGGIHFDQDVTRPDEFSFLHQDFIDPPGQLGGYIELCRFDVAVAAGDALRQRLRPELQPRKVACPPMAARARGRPNSHICVRLILRCEVPAISVSLFLDPPLSAMPSDRRLPAERLVV